MLYDTSLPDASGRLHDGIQLGITAWFLADFQYLPPGYTTTCRQPGDLISSALLAEALEHFLSRVNIL